MLRRWGSDTRKFGFVIRSDEGLTLETSAFQSLYGGQFTLSTLCYTSRIDFLSENVECVPLGARIHFKQACDGVVGVIFYALLITAKLSRLTLVSLF